MLKPLVLDLVYAQRAIVASPWAAAGDARSCIFIRPSSSPGVTSNKAQSATISCSQCCSLPPHPQSLPAAAAAAAATAASSVNYLPACNLLEWLYTVLAIGEAVLRSTSAIQESGLGSLVCVHQQQGPIVSWSMGPQFTRKEHQQVQWAALWVNWFVPVLDWVAFCIRQRALMWPSCSHHETSGIMCSLHGGTSWCFGNCCSYQRCPMSMRMRDGHRIIGSAGTCRHATCHVGWCLWYVLTFQELLDAVWHRGC